MKAGLLKEKIQFVRKNNVQGADGEFKETPIIILDTFASVNFKSNSLDFIAEETNQTQWVEIRIRYRQDHILKTGDLVYWRDRVLKIHSFPFSTDHTYIKITAKTDNNSTSNGLPNPTPISDYVLEGYVLPNYVN